ncbi:hypothetical protein HOD83_00755 [Candidatus Woesearchaeota archaeon]|nr:hypothetical protein [Candidatus Woesearchaeota archaeon]MBT4114040.1 hypothetical protein [Candidatus Woesearchaeota archaeon]MBT4248103.1 hypothetical protein [Candidatus Woesearchaeota archaeon]
MVNMYKEFDKLKGNRYFLPISMVLVVVVVGFIVGPSITGFTVFSNNLNDCKDNLDTCSENVGALTEQKAALDANLVTTHATLSELNTEITRLKDQSQLDKDNWQSDYDDLAAKFNRIVDDAGTNKCCKMQYDNADINSFNIEGDRIDCATDGTFSIEC